MLKGQASPRCKKGSNPTYTSAEPTLLTLLLGLCLFGFFLGGLLLVFFCCGWGGTPVPFRLCGRSVSPPLPLLFSSPFCFFPDLFYGLTVPAVTPPARPFGYSAVKLFPLPVSYPCLRTRFHVCFHPFFYDRWNMHSLSFLCGA